LGQGGALLSESGASAGFGAGRRRALCDRRMRMGEPGKARRFAARLAALLAAALLATALAGCAGGGGTEAGEGTLRVGVRSDIVGFGFYNEGTGKYYGLEIDIAEELAERMGYAD